MPAPGRLSPNLQGGTQRKERGLQGGGAAGGPLAQEQGAQKAAVRLAGKAGVSFLLCLGCVPEEAGVVLVPHFCRCRQHFLPMPSYFLSPLLKAVGGALFGWHGAPKGLSRHAPTGLSPEPRVKRQQWRLGPPAPCCGSPVSPCGRQDAGHGRARVGRKRKLCSLDTEDPSGLGARGGSGWPLLPCKAAECLSPARSWQLGPRGSSHPLEELTQRPL